MQTGRHSRANTRARITFVVASDFERQVVQGSISRLPEYTVGESVSIVNCGVGFTDPGALENSLQCECLVSTGFAAGIQAGVECGTILLPQRIVDTNRLTQRVDQNYHDRIRDVLAKHSAIDTGTVIEVSEILGTRSEKAAIQLYWNASGADMESAKIAAFCARHAIPFIALRVVLDPAHACMPRCITAATTDGKVPGAKQLLAGLVREPNDWQHLAALLRYVFLARRSLRKAILLAMPELLQTPVKDWSDQCGTAWRPAGRVESS
jgi:hypothetical protein